VEADSGTEIRVHGHCHQKAFGTFDSTLAVLRTLPGSSRRGDRVVLLRHGWLFRHEHYDVSMKMAEASLLPAVALRPGGHDRRRGHELPSPDRAWRGARRRAPRLLMASAL
jgi:hypothetical protein